MTQSTGGITFHNLTGTIEVISGLLIGGPGSGLEAGGIDKTFIRNPADGMPYVPGSSLKGKVRSLLERQKSKLTGGSPHSCKEVSCEICRLFGAGDVKDQVPGRGPSRLLFRDARFSDESRRTLNETIVRGDRYFEVKMETRINRDTGTAAGGTLHTFERIPPGAKFDLLITLRALAGDNVDALKGEVERGLKAMENDYLGGSGSRGYGKIAIHLKGWEQAKL